LPKNRKCPTFATAAKYVILGARNWAMLIAIADWFVHCLDHVAPENIVENLDEVSHTTPRSRANSTARLR
jgi:hypothetical protein